MCCQNGLRVGKIKGILFSDCLPEREFRAYFAHSRLLRFVPQQNSFLWPYYDQVCSVTTAKSLGSFLFYYIFPVKLVFVLAYIKRKKDNQGPVARSLVNANRWLRGIKMYRFPWYLTLVSTNHASSNPGLADFSHLALRFGNKLNA